MLSTSWMNLIWLIASLLVLLCFRDKGGQLSIGNDMFITSSDADHGGDKDCGKSMSGYMVKLGSGVVLKLRNRVTISV